MLTGSVPGLIFTPRDVANPPHFKPAHGASRQSPTARRIGITKRSDVRVLVPVRRSEKSPGPSPISRIHERRTRAGAAARYRKCDDTIAGVRSSQHVPSRR